MDYDNDDTVHSSASTNSSSTSSDEGKESEPIAVKRKRRSVPYRTRGAKGGRVFRSKSIRDEKEDDTITRIVEKITGIRSAYIWFVKEHRAAVKLANPDVTFGEIGALLGEQYRALDHKQKVKYAKMEEEDRDRYQRECHERGYTPVTRRHINPATGKRRPQRDPTEPVKVRTKYNYFCSLHNDEVRDRIVKEREEMRKKAPRNKAAQKSVTVADVSKYISPMWAAAKKDAKLMAELQAMVDEDKKRFEREMEAWVPLEIVE